MKQKNPKKSERKMPTKRDLFVKEYPIDLIGTQAAIRAGYSPKSAAQEASRLLNNVNIRARIEKELAERSRRTGVSADRVVRELAKIGFSDITDVADMDEATIKAGAQRDDTAAIKSVSVKKIPTEDGEIIERKIEMLDKTKSLELLGKHLGMFSDKLKIAGDREEPLEVVFNVPRPASEAEPEEKDELEDGSD